MSFVDGFFWFFEGLWIFIVLGDSGCKIVFVLDIDYVGWFGVSVIKLGF